MAEVNKMYYKEIHLMKKLSLLYILFDVLGLYMYYNGDKFVDIQGYILLSNDGIDSFLNLPWYFYYLSMIWGYISLAAICHRKFWGLLSLITIAVVDFFLFYLSGIRVYLPIDMAFGYIILLLWGCILSASIWLPRDYWK